MDAFEDFWSSSDLIDADIPSAEEELEQARADAKRDRKWLLEQFGRYRDLSREDAGNGLNYHALRPIRLKTWILLSRGPEPGCSSEFTLKRSQE